MYDACFRYFYILFSLALILLLCQIGKCSVRRFGILTCLEFHSTYPWRYQRSRAPHNADEYFKKRFISCILAGIFQNNKKKHPELARLLFTAKTLVSAVSIYRISAKSIFPQVNNKTRLGCNFYTNFPYNKYHRLEKIFWKCSIKRVNFVLAFSLPRHSGIQNNEHILCTA